MVHAQILALKYTFRDDEIISQSGVCVCVCVCVCVRERERERELGYCLAGGICVPRTSKFA
jgi:hypothetical protein